MKRLCQPPARCASSESTASASPVPAASRGRCRACRAAVARPQGKPPSLRGDRGESAERQIEAGARVPRLRAGWPGAAPGPLGWEGTAPASRSHRSRPAPPCGRAPRPTLLGCLQCRFPSAACTTTRKRESGAPRSSRSALIHGRHPPGRSCSAPTGLGCHSRRPCASRDTRPRAQRGAAPATPRFAGPRRTGRAGAEAGDRSPGVAIRAPASAGSRKRVTSAATTRPETA